MTHFSILQLLTFILPLLFLEGFYSGSEIALLSADRLALMRQAKKGGKSAQLALDLVKNPQLVLSTTLFITHLCVIGISTFIALFTLENYPLHAKLLAIIITSPLVVLFGELIPKTVFQTHATTLAVWVAWPVRGAYFLLYPITRLLGAYTSKLSRIIIPIEELLSGKKNTTREQIRTFLSFPANETEIKSSEKLILNRIFDFKDTEAQHALIPLVSVDAIEKSSTVQSALRKFEKHRHSRMPVFTNRIDNIIGVLEATDLLSATNLQESIDLYITPAHYVAETQSLDNLVRDMRREDNEMVVIVDEHGGAVGILTFEDIIEEIVGEISDEYDRDIAPYKELAPDRWTIQAKMEIQQINEIMKLAIPEGNYETLSGFLLQQFGRIPEPRDQLFFDTRSGTFQFTIQKATDRHIETVLVQKIKEV